MLSRTTTRTSFKQRLPLLVGAAVSFLCTEMPAQQPNILIVNIDDMGRGDFHSYGSAYSQTPHIAELPAGGTRLSHCHTAAPICSPRRAALMTGQYAARSGINSFLEGTASNLARDNANSL